jgi:hypothetical protein
MKPALRVIGTLVFVAVLGLIMFLGEGRCQSTSQASSMTESQARKLLSDSPWAKRAKVRSITNAPTYLPSVENPGKQQGGLGPGGPGHGYVPPTAAEIVNQASEPRMMPCLGWGIGSMTMISPTSEECKAAWQSVSAAKSAGLQRNSVIVLWESATPVREAQAKLDIAEPSSARATDTIVISMIAHPVLNQINPHAPQMKQLIRESAVLLSNGRQEIKASDVAFIEADESVVRFVFPRTQSIGIGDKECIFRFEISDTTVEAKFNLKEMVYGGKSAL